MAQTLKFGNGTWATKKGSTLAHNDEGGNFKPLPFTYTGAGKGTRVNKQGLIEVVENDRPRIDYLDSKDGVFLLEKASTNLITHSEDFSNEAWVKTGLTVDTNQILSPYGSLDADEVNITTANAHYLFDTISVSASTNYTFTFYVKKGTATDVSYSILNAINFTNIVNTTSYFNEISDTKWTRISVEFTTPSGCTSIRTYPLRDGLSIGTVYIWGAMLEQGSYATSYIPNYGTSAGITRVADTANGAGDASTFNDSEGVLMAETKGENDGTFNYISLSDGGTTNYAGILYTDTDNQITYRYYVGGSGVQIIIENIIVTNFNKIAIKYKANDFAIWINGIEVGTASSGSLNPSGTFNQLAFARGGSNNTPFYGNTKQIQYFDSALNDSDLETITSWTSFTDLANGQTYSIK